MAGWLRFSGSQGGSGHHFHLRRAEPDPDNPVEHTNHGGNRSRLTHRGIHRQCGFEVFRPGRPWAMTVDSRKTVGPCRRAVVPGFTELPFVITFMMSPIQ